MARKKQIISLDIGNSCIKAVAGVKSDKSIKIISSAIEVMPEGCYSNGVVKDSAKFGEVINGIIHQLGVKTNNVVLSYESNEIIKRELIIPKVSDEDIEDLLGYEITNYLPIDIDNYVLQHKVIEVVEENKLKVNVVAVPYSIASGLFDAIRTLGYNPIGMDLHTNGMELLVDDSLEETVAIVDIGYKHTNVSIFENGVYVFNRIINGGLNVFDSGFELFLQDDSEPVEKAEDTDIVKIYDEAELEELRRTVKVAEIWQQYRYGDLSNQEMELSERMAIDEVVVGMDSLLDEIEKVIRFQLKRSSDSTIDRVKIYGGGAMHSGMGKAIERKLQIPTEVVYYGELITINQPNELMLVNAVTAIGSELNFFKPFVKEKPKTNSKKILMIALLLVLLAGCVYFTGMMIIKENNLKQEIELLNSQITDAQTIRALEQITEKETLLSQIETQSQVLQQANLEFMRENTMSNELIDLINKQLSDKVFLTNINISGADVSLTGVGYDHQNISQFVHNLRETQVFDVIDLSSVDNDQDNYSFEVSLVLKDVLAEEATNEN